MPQPKLDLHKVRAAMADTSTIDSLTADDLTRIAFGVGPDGELIGDDIDILPIEGPKKK